MSEKELLHHFAEACARTSPDAAAWICGADRLTYRELERQSNQLAHRLRRLGVGPEVPVGVFLHRGLPLIVAIQGVLKAGGAYVPLDPNYPPERLSFMLEDSQAKILVTQPELSSGLPGSAPEVLVLGGSLEDEPENDPPRSGVGPGNLAYLIYTSGSTGRPKGAAIQHHSAVALMRWAADFFSPEEAARVLFSTSICFDVSIFELFLPAALGTTGVVADNALGLLELPESAQVTLVSSAPSAMAEMARLGGVPPSVRTVVLAGEALPGSLADDLYRIPTVERVCNLYGPSEDTTYSTWSVVPRQRSGAPSIGRPIAGGRVHLVDESFQPVPAGVRGEILLGGAGLARGYLGRPDLTAERFVPDPFSGEPGERFYRTGDLGSYGADGELDFHGRIDHQVKIRGLRIEPGEIEAALGSHPAVSEAAVVVQEVRTGPMLVAFYTLREGQTLHVSHLRRFLQATLPSFMIPARFVRLDRLPVTPNGKVDRRHLAGLPADEDDETGTVPPRNRLEAELRQIWEEVLQVSPIGVTDNFFALGGHSLLAIYLMISIRRRLGKNLPVPMLIQAPTIEKLALLLQSHYPQLRFRCLVPLQPAGTKPPFFCVHGAGGNVFRLIGLARLLGDRDPERPVYGIQARGLEDGNEPLRSVEEMADYYVEAVRSVQPAGPYFLGGYSMGGVIAYEMALRFHQLGEEVAFLGMLDAPPRPGALLPALDRSSIVLLFARDLQIPVAPADLAGLSPDEQLAYVLAEGVRVHRIPREFSFRETDLYVRLTETTIDASRRYQATRPYPGRITVFKGAGLASGLEGSWSDVHNAELSEIEIPGDHRTMFDPPNVEIIRDLLQDCLEEAAVSLVVS